MPVRILRILISVIKLAITAPIVVFIGFVSLMPVSSTSHAGALNLFGFAAVIIVFSSLPINPLVVPFLLYFNRYITISIFLWDFPLQNSGGYIIHPIFHCFHCREFFFGIRNRNYFASNYLLRVGSIKFLGLPLPASLLWRVIFIWGSRTVMKWHNFISCWNVHKFFFIKCNFVI